MCVLTCFTCSFLLKLIWKVPNMLVNIFVGNIRVGLPKGPAKGPQRGPKVCLDTALAVSTYAWQTMASRCVYAPSSTDVAPYLGWDTKKPIPSLRRA